MIDAIQIVLWFGGSFLIALVGWHKYLRAVRKLEELEMKLRAARLDIARYATLLGMPDDQLRRDLEQLFS